MFKIFGSHLQYLQITDSTEQQANAHLNMWYLIYTMFHYVHTVVIS